MTETRPLPAAAGTASLGPRGAVTWWPRIAIAATVVAAILAAAWGAGAFGGTPIEDAADGALAADATLLAPGTGAFAIWSVIYGGLALFAILVLVPRTADSARLRSARWHVAAAAVLNAVWIAVVQRGALLASVGVLIAIVIALAWAVARLARSRPESFWEAVALDAPVGLYLGWSCVATAANIAAAGRVELDAEADHGRWMAVAALAALLCVMIAMMRDLRPSTVLPWSIALAGIWGTIWIGLARLEDSPADEVVGWAAVAVALAIASAAWIADLTVALARRRRRLGRI